MQFVLNGPDLPEDLLQQHEEGRVVFFCGAGISYRLGLPGFEGLVKSIRNVVGDAPNEEEKKLDDQKRWDRSLDYLEKKLSSPREMRKAMVDVLTPKNVDESAYDTHRALLSLSRVWDCRGKRSAVHLVTTNFDRAFEYIRKDFDLSFRPYAAPFLPVPKKMNWNGVVYLHGLIPQNIEHDDCLENLIVTSGGFGRAYLSERWAARFVTELLRNYVVCFVGYSLSDPVMRYLVDAVDADRMSGEETNNVYMFLEQTELSDLFGVSRNKTIIPIPYDNSDSHHAKLHDTLRKWSDEYGLGSEGKVAIVETESAHDPSLEPDTGYKARVLWALSDKSGIPARRFAERKPLPPIGWLTAFDDKFKLKNAESVERPVVEFGAWEENVDVRSRYLYEWATLYLNHPLLIERCVKCGEMLNPYFKQRVLIKLSEYEKMRTANDEDGLKEIRERWPYAIPDEFASKIWHLLLLGRLLPVKDWHADILSLVTRAKAGVFDWFTSNRIADCFAPKIRVKKSWSSSRADSSKSVEEYFEWDLDNAYDHGACFAKEIRYSLTSNCRMLLDEMLRRVISVLDDACYLDQYAECGIKMVCDIPSIENHFQNSEDVHSWRGAIDIIRDAWMRIADDDPDTGLKYYRSWMNSGHWLLRRMALFAAKKDGVVPSSEWVEDITANHGFLLWQPSSRREICRLLATAGQRLSSAELKMLTDVIVEGPPPCMFVRYEHQDEDAARMRDHMRWLRLIKLDESHCHLPDAVVGLLNSLKSKYGFSCSKWQQEEFLTWHSGTGCPDYEEERYVLQLPTDEENLAGTLSDDSWDAKASSWGCEGDDFGQICKANPATVSAAVGRMVDNGIWKVERWRTLLREWRSPDLMQHAEDLLKKALPLMPESVFNELSKDLGFWSQEAVKAKLISGDLLLAISERIISRSSFDSEDKSENYGFGPVGAAINNQVGIIVEAGLDFCFPGQIHKGAGIGDPWRKIFTIVCKTDGLWMRYGRCVLASWCVALYFADESWVRTNLLPKFNWERNPEEALVLWAGFLRHHRIHAPLLLHLKDDLFKCIDYIGQFYEEDATQYCSFVTAMGVIGMNGYEYADYRELFQKFGIRELESSVKTLVEILESHSRKGSDDADARWTCESCWGRQIKPFIDAVWPKDKTLLSPRISASFCRLICSSGEAFPDALRVLSRYLTSCDDHFYFLHQIESNGLAKQFPREVLELLSLVMDDIKWSGSQLRKVLDELVSADVSLRKCDEYKRLDELLKEVAC